MKITWQGKEVQNPVFRVLLVVFAVSCAVLFIGLTIVLLPIWLPLHFLLHAVGLKGFIRPEPGGKISIKLGPDAFTRRT